MAPHVAPSSPTLQPQEEVYDLNVPFKKSSNSGDHWGERKYSQYLPTWDKIYFPPCPEFEFVDPALRANPSKPNLLKPGVKVNKISPKMGTELSGIQLTDMSDAAKDELALLVSERKCVVLRDQNFAEWGPENQQDFAKHFGKPNYQPVTGTVPGYPGFHIIYRDGNQAEIDNYFAQKSTATLWHHDVSYERQPPGYVLLCMLEGPEEGGDTVVASMTEAYNRLSPGFREMLENLRATHSSEKLCHFAKSHGGLVRKDPVKSVHPVVRVHPVTGEKSLFVNEEWITGIEGWKQAETEWLLRYLTDHISKGHDFQIRLRWRPGTVTIFDNRSTLHTATIDYDNVYSKERHVFRLAAMAEKPIPVGGYQ